MNAYLQLIQPEIQAIFQKPYEQIFGEIWSYYEQNMLEHFPYIGGDTFSGTKNLTGCMFFIAIGVVGKGYGLSTHNWGRLITTLYGRHAEKMPRALLLTVSFLFNRHPMIVRKLLTVKDKRNQKNAAKNPGSFVTEMIEPTAEYPIIFYNHVCPIYEFCREYGYMEYLPYMCNLDYVMFRSVGVSLYREKTCAAGDGVCDFKLGLSLPPPSVWPPHFLDPTDPLK